MMGTLPNLRTKSETVSLQLDMNDNQMKYERAVGDLTYSSNKVGKSGWGFDRIIKQSMKYLLGT